MNGFSAFVLPRFDLRRVRNAAALVGVAVFAGWAVAADALVPLADVATVAAGSQHTCALTTSGGVKCWGSNGNGSLGDGTYTQYSFAVDVKGLASGVTAITSGQYHSCALTAGGGIKCWGANGYGQLGDNSTNLRRVPVDVTGFTTGAIAVAAGDNHTCALTTGGAVKCWGNNANGQLGDNSTAQKLTPVDVEGLASGVIAIAGGGNHTCALTSGQGVKCWGANNYGQLGDDTTAQKLVPVDAVGLASGVAAITAGGNHSCVRTTLGGAKCWGANYTGQLGDNTSTQRSHAVDVSGLTTGVAAIEAGYNFTCAVTTGGAARCWGYNDRGMLGDGTNANRIAPVAVTGLGSGVAAVSSGGAHACAVLSGGGVQCWGSNDNGQLGDGTNDAVRATPVDVGGLGSGMAGVAAGNGRTCAITTGGGMKCVGANGSGQLGDGTRTHALTPVNVSGLTSGVTVMALGGGHSCALVGGGVKCWGSNGSGQLGDNSTTTRLTPVDVTGLASGALAIAAGEGYSCAVVTGGGVRCWGFNAYGQLGDNTTGQRLVPTDVSGLDSGISSITAGKQHTCALTSGGGVKCWGGNSYGQLGDNTTTQKLTPVDVTGLSSGVLAIAAGDNHTCAITAGGGLKCWGQNDYGQLGDNSYTPRPAPVDVSGLTSGVAAVDGGSLHTCALTTGGGVKCWGAAWQGAVGDGSLVRDRKVPVDVSGLASGVTAIATGASHSCALTSGGAIKCWGDNVYGETTGDGKAGFRAIPVAAMVQIDAFAPGSTPIASAANATPTIVTAWSVTCPASGRVLVSGSGESTALSSNPGPAFIGLAYSIALDVGATDNGNVVQSSALAVFNGDANRDFLNVQRVDSCTPGEVYDYILTAYRTTPDTSAGSFVWNGRLTASEPLSFPGTGFAAGTTMVGSADNAAPTIVTTLPVTCPASGKVLVSGSGESAAVSANPGKAFIGLAYSIARDSLATDNGNVVQSSALAVFNGDANRDFLNVQRVDSCSPGATSTYRLTAYRTTADTSGISFVWNGRLTASDPLSLPGTGFAAGSTPIASAANAAPTIIATLPVTCPTSAKVLVGGSGESAALSTNPGTAFIGLAYSIARDSEATDNGNIVQSSALAVFNGDANRDFLNVQRADSCTVGTTSTYRLTAYRTTPDTSGGSFVWNGRLAAIALP